MFIDLYKCSVMADALETKQAYTSIIKKMWLQICIINLVVCQPDE